MELWLVGKIKSRKEYKTFEFQGVFDSEQKAINACENFRYFVAPATLNEELPEESATWPGCYYPIVEDESAK